MENIHLFKKGGEIVSVNEMIQLDIKNEIEELEKDLKFLEFIQSEDIYNVKSNF